MKCYWFIIKVVLVLGFFNIVRVVGYCVGVCLGINKVCRLYVDVLIGVFFVSLNLFVVDVFVVFGWCYEVSWFGCWFV